jgi:hypothetical protein
LKNDTLLEVKEEIEERKMEDEKDLDIQQSEM